MVPLWFGPYLTTNLKNEPNHRRNYFKFTKKIFLFQISKCIHFSTIRMMWKNAWHHKWRNSSSLKWPQSILNTLYNKIGNTSFHSISIAKSYICMLYTLFDDENLETKNVCYFCCQKNSTSFFFSKKERYFFIIEWKWCFIVLLLNFAM